MQMTAQECKDCLLKLGISVGRTADLFAVCSSTVERWLDGRAGCSGGVAIVLRAMRDGKLSLEVADGYKENTMQGVIAPRQRRAGRRRVVGGGDVGLR